MDNLPIFDSQHIGDNSVFDPSKSLYIEASAGTGKTYTIQQIVARLIFDKIPIHKILLVTYTEKAVGELKNRIREKIQEVLESGQLVKGVEPKLAEDKLTLFETALRDLDSAQIFTIHSFCQKTLRTYAYDAWRPFAMQLVDDSLVKNIIQRKLRDEWPHDKDFQALLGDDDAQDAMHEDGNSIKTVADDLETKLMHAISKYYLDEQGMENEDVIHLVEPTLIKDIKDINDFKADDAFMDIYQTLQKYPDHKPTKTGKKTIKDLLSELDTWQVSKNFFNGKSYPDPNKPSFSPAWPPELLEAYKKLYAFKKDNTVYFQKDYLKELYQFKINTFLYRELPKIYRAWRREKLEYKYESYQDMITVVHQAVVKDNDTPLQTALRKAYRYAIIDEFQDTNRLQWDIFRTLFFNVPDHSIFVVGDPKQSIYAFQGADLAVYQKAIRDIGHGQRLDTNYRSTTELIQACNCLFSPTTGSTFFNDGQPRFSDSKSPANKITTHFDGTPTQPVWLSEEDIAPNKFAQLAVQTIVECCSQKEGGKTRLQIFDKQNSSCLRNVSLKDFAVLARTRSEFPPIEAELKKLGIPFVRYKDDNLFNSRECMQWIALFKAIDSDDFSAYKRRILNEALLTDFFPPVTANPSQPLRKIYTVHGDHYDDPFCKERQQIAKYHAFAQKFSWAEMLECIYHESGIETRTAQDLSKLQSLAKFQQIGNYSIEYLYANRCTLQELIKHLDQLQKKADDLCDKDGNLVARDTDLDAVQLMTIHASKGLEFPIVISVAGFKQYNNLAKGPYIYHDEKTDRKMLGFDSDAKENQKAEDIKEWKRLFYVAYTRASALLILPRYKKCCDDFLKASFQAFASKTEYICNLTEKEVCRDDVQKILHTSGAHHDTPEDLVTQQKEQQTCIQALQNSIGQKCLFQHSYSSLAGKVPPHTQEMYDDHGKSTDFASDGEDEDEETLPRPAHAIDPQSLHICHIEDYQPDCVTAIAADYPTGKQLGNAIHEILEKIDFAKTRDSKDAFQKDPEVIGLIDKAFAKYGLPLTHHENWRTMTADMVWHTLNAKLPVITDNTDTTTPFALNELASNEHFAEVEFFLEGDKKDRPKSGEYYCKGFIDLVFARNDAAGDRRYAILDWKSDRLEPAAYSDPTALKEKVDLHYAIQRVLYAYCLIQWLKQFYPSLSEAEIFNQHFGGVYYAFVRGTSHGTANGIYAQTWSSYDMLKENYHKLIEYMFKSAPQGE